MALEDLREQINKVDCSASDVGATGLAPCPFDWDRIVTAEFSNKNFRYEDAQNLEYIQEQQQLGNLIIVSGYESFTNTTPDPNINTVEGSGFQQVMGEMPTSFTGVLNNGVLNWKALRTLNGKDNWNVALYDASGNKIFTETKSGAVKGFGLKMLFTGTYKGKEGNNPSNYTQMLQFSDLMEMERMAWIVAEELDYDVSDIDGWNGVDLTFNPVVASATTLVLDAKLLDRTHLLEGTLVTNWRITKNGTPIVPSAISYTTNPGKITFTVPAVVASDVYTAQTYDTALATDIINITGVLYRSDLATVTASA